MREKERRITLKEAKILEALIHPNIIRFREVYKTKTGKLCIVMDFADGNNTTFYKKFTFLDGDLYQLIQKQKKLKRLMRENLILNWFT